MKTSDKNRAHLVLPCADCGNTHDIKDNARRDTYFVDCAYATSPDAVRFGFGKDGCHVVTQRQPGQPDKSVAGFAGREDAERWSDWLNKPAGGEVAYSDLTESPAK